MRRLVSPGALALALWALGAAGVVAALLLAPRNGDASLIADQGVSSLLLVAAFTAVGVVGVVVTVKRPRNAVGWMFLGTFVLIGVLIWAQEHATFTLGVRPGALPGGVLAAWVAAWAWFPSIAVFFIFVPLLFPTGRPPTPRWRIVGWAGGLSVALVTVHSALAETLSGDAYAVANPIGIPGVVGEQGPVDAAATLLAAASVVGAVVSLVVRFRRARGDERQQLKWFTFAVALLPVLVILDYLPLRLPAVVDDAVFAVVIALVPLAAGLAILRYRLWDIDRIISRTLAYALLTALLGTVYITGVLLLSRLFAPVGGRSDLAVAGATLAAAAVFTPARRRIQTAVDRRFNRARYDAQRQVDRFRDRLRDEVDVAGLQWAVQEALAATVQPAQMSLWMRPPEVRA